MAPCHILIVRKYHVVLYHVRSKPIHSPLTIPKQEGFEIINLVGHFSQRTFNRPATVSLKFQDGCHGLQRAVYAEQGRQLMWR